MKGTRSSWNPRDTSFAGASDMMITLICCFAMQSNNTPTSCVDRTKVGRRYHNDLTTKVSPCIRGESSVSDHNRAMLGSCVLILVSPGYGSKRLMTNEMVCEHTTESH